MFLMSNSELIYVHTNIAYKLLAMLIELFMQRIISQDVPLIVYVLNLFIRLAIAQIPNKKRFNPR